MSYFEFARFAIKFPTRAKCLQNSTGHADSVFVKSRAEIIKLDAIILMDSLFILANFQLHANFVHEASSGLFSQVFACNRGFSCIFLICLLITGFLTWQMQAAVVASSPSLRPHSGCAACLCNCILMIAVACCQRINCF